MKIDDMVAAARAGAVKPAMLPNAETGVLEPSYIVILDKEPEWVPMTPERLLEMGKQGFVRVNNTRIVEDNKLPDGPKRIQPFKKRKRR